LLHVERHWHRPPSGTAGYARQEIIAFVEAVTRAASPRHLDTALAAAVRWTAVDVNDDWSMIFLFQKQ
jgi:hypothetical protein